MHKSAVLLLYLLLASAAGTSVATASALNNHTHNETVPSSSPIPLIPNPNQAPMMFTVLSISSGMSLAGSMFIILSWLLFTDMHFFSRKLIVYIAATDFFSSCAFLYAGIRKTGLLSNKGGKASLECTIQGFTLQFFVLASYLWTACFAYHLHQLITKKRKKAHQLEVYYHSVSWGFPILITIVLVVEKLTMHSDIVGGADRPWCWLTNHASQNETYDMEMLQQFLLFYLPSVLIFSYNVSIYVFLARQVHGTELGANIRKRVLLYLLVFSVCAVWGLVHRIYQLFSVDHQPSKYLTYLESFFGPWQGFLNALVYGVSARVVVRYKRLCGCRVSSLEDEEGVRRSSSLARSRQGSAPLDAAARWQHHPNENSSSHYRPLAGGAMSDDEESGGLTGEHQGTRTAPLRVPVSVKANVLLGGDGSALGPATNSSPRSYSDQSVFVRSSQGMLLGKDRVRR